MKPTNQELIERAKNIDGAGVFKLKDLLPSAFKLN